MNRISIMSAISIAILFLSIVSMSSQTTKWANNIGGSGSDRIPKVGLDADGNSYVGGMFNSSNIDLGNGKILHSAGGYDGFLIKYDASGVCQWAESIGNSGDDRVYAIATDEMGNSFVAGFFTSTTLTFNDGTVLTKSSGSNDGYLAKYDKDGNCQWAKGIKSNGYAEVTDIGIGSSGEIFVTGYYNSSQLVFDENNSSFNLSTQGSNDGFLAKYGAQGDCRWATSIGGNGDDRVYNLTVRNGSALISGYYDNGPLTFTGDSWHNYKFTSVGERDIFVAMYGSNGLLDWAKTFGGTGNEEVGSIVVSQSGYVYVAGHYKSATINAGGEWSLNNAGGYDIFLAKYNIDSEFYWVKQIASSGDDLAYMLSLDDYGYIYMGGEYGATCNFGNGVSLEKSAGSNDAFFTKFNSGGSCFWAERIAGSNAENIRGIAVDSDGYIFVSGEYTSSTLNFNNGKTISKVSGDDAFIAKYSPANPLSLPIVTGPIKTSGVISSAAVSGGEVFDNNDDGPEITERGVCISTTRYPNINNVKILADDAGVGSFVVSITGLLPATKYYVRAFATNANGTVYSDERTFTTAPMPPGAH